MAKTSTVEYLRATFLLEEKVKDWVSRYEASGDFVFLSWANGAVIFWMTCFSSFVPKDLGRINSLIFNARYVPQAPAECRGEAKSGRGFELLEAGSQSYDDFVMSAEANAVPFALEMSS